MPLLSLVVMLSIACGEDEERDSPPVGVASANPSAMSTANPNTSDTSMGTMGSGLTTSGDASSGGVFPVIEGRLLDGMGLVDLPINCIVRFHSPGEIEPSSGLSTGVTFSRPFEITTYPKAFSIDSEEAGGTVMAGDEGYITADCDIDGDNLFDDNFGGFYSGLPLTRVTVPVSAVDFIIGPL